MDRYHNLLLAIEEIAAVGTQHLTYVEVGTYDGVRAIGLLKRWCSFGPEHTAHYRGFDLFEDLTSAMSRAESSKARLPPSMASVRARMADELPPECLVTLAKGNTRSTLATACPKIGKADLIFMDGGHSQETVASDWSHLCRLMRSYTVCLLDDYYEHRTKFGCNRLVSALGPKYKVTRLEPLDSYKHNGVKVRMVRVRLA